MASCASADIGLVLKKLPREMKHSAYSLLILSIAAYGINSLSQTAQGKCSVITASSRTESLLEQFFSIDFKEQYMHCTGNNLF